MTCAVAVDAMGGDHAPRVVVEGAVQVAAADPNLRLFLVGQEKPIAAELEAAGWKGANIEVVPAAVVIGMGESPVEAIRKKRGSSIEVALKLVREGRASAFVSAGNTGACVAAATLRLGLLPEVRRAGIAVTFHPGPKPVVVIDVGANVASRPDHLIQYGIMASLFAREVLQVESPRVGLLNVGEEDEKGNSLAKTTHSLFRQTRLNFLGNVEGVDVFRGDCDVVVCDGFVGNIVLKVSEGLAERLVDLFKMGLEQSLQGLRQRLRAVMAGSGGGAGAAGGGSTAGGGSAAGGDGMEALFRESFGGMLKKIDYSEYGGAPLLGVNGVVIIAHGRSDAKAIGNAVRAAQRMSEANVNQRITEEIRALSLAKDSEPAEGAAVSLDG